MVPPPPGPDGVPQSFMLSLLKEKTTDEEKENINKEVEKPAAHDVKCEHMWPTPADLYSFKNKPRSQWVRPEPITVQDIDFYLGRMPEWYIEEKLLKDPGDYLIARGHDNKLRLSVKSSEPDNPTVHLIIEFCQTKQIRGDRNYYYRIEKTVLQNRSVWGLIQAYRSSTVNSLKINTKRNVHLLTPILPCQNCRYLKTEYSFHNVQVRDRSEINIGELVAKGERSTIYKAVRTIVYKGIVNTKVESPVILKEFDDYSTQTLDQIYREMHVVNTIRHEIGWDTAIHVEAIIVISRPYYIAYKYCKNGSLLNYMKKNPSMGQIEKLRILQDIACTLHHCQKLNLIHGSIRAKNIFVDSQEDTSGKHLRTIYYIVDPQKITNKRGMAPEVLQTQQLTPETDVFAFAYFMYEVITGQMPFPKFTRHNVLPEIKKNPKFRPDLPKTLPKWLNELINEAWDTDPKKRPKISDIWRTLKRKNKEEK